MLPTPSTPEVPTPFEETTPTPKRWALILSFVFSFVLISGIVVVIAMSSNANASTYSLTGSGGNWTSPVSWSCTGTSAPGSTGCAGGFPGGGGVDGDVANISSGATVSVTSSVANAVTLNASGGTLQVGGTGQLNLVGTSGVTSSAGLFIGGGTLNNAGTFTLSSLGTQTFDGGTLGGAGTTNVNSTFSLTGTAGPMIISGQTINNASTINFSSTANSLTLNGTLANTGTFSLTGDAAILGSGPINNSGTFQKTGGTGTTSISPQFNNSGSVAVAISLVRLALNGGGTHTGAFNVFGPGAGFNFNSAHTFNTGASFPSATGDVQIVGGSFNVNTPLTMSIPLSNSGTIGFGGAAQTFSLNSYTQTGSGTFAPRLISNGVNDKLAVSGTASIGGTLLPNPTYTPAVGDAFTVLTGAPVSGTMSYTPINYPGKQIQASFSAAAVSLAVAPTDADLGINITDAPDPVLAGAPVTYTAQISNAGPAAAATPSVSFTLAGGTITAVNGGGNFSCTNTATTASCTFGAPGMANGFSGPITVTATAGTVASMSLGGTVSSTTNDPIPGNNTSSQATTITPAADLQIIKTGPATVNAGQNAVYTINVTNNGPSTATSVVVNDTPPAGTTFVSNAGACTSNFPCTIASMTSGQTVTITSTYSVPASATGTLTNTATVSTTSATDTNGGNNSSTTTPASITASTDYAVIKTGPSTAATGSTITYSVEVKNFGPSDGTGTVTVSDPTPTGLTLLSVSGGGCTAYPCNVGPLAAGTFVTITGTYKVTATSGSVTNTASIALAATDPNSANNSQSVTTTITPNADLSITKNAPRTFSSTGSVTFTITVTNNGPGTALNVSVNDPTPAGLTFASNSGACSTPFPCNLGSMNSGTSLTINARYVADAGVVSATNRATVTSTTQDLNTANNTATRTVVSACPSAPPIISPIAGTLTSPVTFTWGPAAGADSYTLFVGSNGAAPSAVGQPTTATSLTTDIPNGTITWYVLATSAACPVGTQSDIGSFNACSAPAAPEAGVVGAPTSGQPYAVLWDPVLNASGYEIQEATNESFTDAVTQSTSAPSVTFTHTTTAGALVFFYRVRALGACNATAGAYSRIVRVVVLPPPANQKYPNFDIPAGTQNRVQLEVFIEGEPSGPQNFTITLDKPWMLSVDPSSGVLPTAGRKVTLTVDPSQLPNGTFTGTLLVELTPVSSNSRQESNATKPKATPVTVNLVTPIIPTTPTGPTPDTIIIPAVGRLTGINSQWRSDVRVFNGSSQALKYQLDFLPSQATESKKTTLSTAPGDTTALDDIIHNWYGFGEVGDNASGVLQIRALTSNGSPSSSASLATVVSSRTYNNTPNQGTLGQFIPGIFFRNFIGRQTDASKAVAVLSLQQLAQTNSYRTNVGLVEGSGAPATVLLSVFNSGGQKLTQDFSISLKAGEQVALNQLLAQKGITANDARLEVRVTGGDGKVTAYASVVDNNSLDPLLVSPVILGQTTARTYVLPGVADLNTGSASWRSDLRILNGSSVPQAVDLLFYPQGNAGNPAVASLTVNPGEVKVLDNVLASLFSTTNAGGAVHVNTVNDSQLVVTGRTFNQTGNGTLGQFIPAATLQDGIDRTTRALNILQVEDSVRYRTNVGLAEMSGQSATVQVSVNLPDSKVTPTIQIPLAANEFRQFALRDLGLANIYNARVSISVISGNGKVTAYGSVIDMTTSDPTYVPAQ